MNPDNENIKYKHNKIPQTGTRGLAGTLKGRGNSGLVLRKITTPKQTKANALKVPILTKAAKLWIGANPANREN